MLKALVYPPRKHQEDTLNIGYILLGIGACLIGMGGGMYVVNASTTAIALLVIGIAVFAIGMLSVMKVRKQQKTQREAARASGLTSDGYRQTVCPNCGLNIIPNTPYCPRCNTPFDWSLK